ncbi:MAG: AraC family transcriptional regulator [Sphingopyxis sp.]|nr:AraC family transcriptional regulator [Sphingopyxis sp.]
MSQTETRADRPYHAGTDLAACEKVSWSAPPEVAVYDTGELPINAVRHYCTHATGTVRAGSTGGNDEWDALLVNRGGSGMLEIECDGHFAKSPLRRDVCAFIPCGADSIFEFPASAGAFTLYFPVGFIPTLPDEKPSGEIMPILAERDGRLAQLMGMVEHEFISPTFGSTLLVDGLIRAIAVMLTKHDSARLAHESERIYLTPLKLKRVTEYVEENLELNIRLDDLAKAAGLSPYHFSRVFKLATGETPYHYLRSRRIERARTMLSQNSAPLAELALTCGFANQSHFTAAFTRELGMSPGRFRRLAAK